MSLRQQGEIRAYANFTGKIKAAQYITDLARAQKCMEEALAALEINLENARREVQ